jgi:hypothetical protein
MCKALGSIPRTTKKKKKKEKKKDRKERKEGRKCSEHLFNKGSLSRVNYQQFVVLFVAFQDGHNLAPVSS